MSHRSLYRLAPGQEIAYARSINVVPPWTAKQQAAEAKATKK